MAAINGGSPNTFQASIQQTEAQNQAEIQQRREGQEALRNERTEQTQDTQQAQQGGSRQAILENTNEGQQAAATDPSQRIGGRVDIQV